MQDGQVEVTVGRAGAEYVEWTPVEATRVLLGGPPVGAASRGPSWLRALLPVPVYLPPLDHV